VCGHTTMSDNKPSESIPPRPKLNDNDIEDAILIEKQIAASTAKQRIARQAVPSEYEPETERVW